VTPQFGVVLFWVLACTLLLGAGFMFAQGNILMGSVTIGLVLLWRVFFETVTVLFQIHSVLVDIRDADKVQQAEAERKRKLERARELAASKQLAQPGETRLQTF
jgi:hypothetical protein